MIRKESYEMFIIPSLEKMILVCDEEGNSTFIINRLSETPHFYYSLSKDQLKALKDSELIDQIDWRNLDKWKEDLLNSLTKPKQSNYEQLTEDEIKKILENIKQKICISKEEKSKNFLSFNEAKELAKSIWFKDERDYQKKYKEYRGLPAAPQWYYKNKGWIDWYDFLGKEKPVEILSFNEAKNLVRNANFKDIEDYQKNYKEYRGLPADPRSYYKNKGWINWYDFLEKEKSVEILSFNEAKKLAINIGFEDVEDYQKRYKKYPGLPMTPQNYYKNKGWIDWYDFLGKEKSKNFLSFNEAKKLAINIGFENAKDYQKKYKEYRGLPAAPQWYYKNKGWIDWYDFLGKEKPIEFLSFDEAKNLVRNANFKCKEYYQKNYKEYPGLPGDPQNYYKNKEWIDWYDFLGKEKNKES